MFLCLRYRQRLWDDFIEGVCTLNSSFPDRSQIFIFWGYPISFLAQNSFSIFERIYLLICNLLLQHYFSFWSVLLPLLQLLFDLLFTFAIVGSKLKFVTFWDNLHLCIGLWPSSVLNIQSFHFFFESFGCWHIHKI